MPGNERLICEFLFDNLGAIELNHIVIVETLGAPRTGGSEGFIPITQRTQINLVTSADSRKKADVYINGKGVSLKQSGSSFSFNRLQRANLFEVYSLLEFNNIEERLNLIDNEIRRFHQGLLERRNRPWQNFFNETDFKDLLSFLMMRGAPNVGFSAHPADLILEAPEISISASKISVFTFDEYFETYRAKFKIAIRRQWIGQSSNSEHARAVGLANKPGNAPWVFDDVVGSPRTGWRRGFPTDQRKTVYFLMIEKER